MIRKLILLLFRFIMRIYFRSVRSIGNAPSKDVRGRLFIANHHNAIVDPILVLTDAPCAISPVAKSTLWKIPGFRWLLDIAQAVPIVRRQDDPTKQSSDNDATFSQIAKHLASGGNILIFPEGKSHSEPKLAPLRSGAARMLLAAAAENPGASLSYQAVALEFDGKDVFRSNTAMVWGDVHRVREADNVEQLTNEMAQALRSQLVEGATDEDRLLITQVAQLWHNREAKTAGARDAPAFGAEVEVAKNVERVGNQLLARQPERVASVRTTVAEYYAALAQAKLGDDDVAFADRKRSVGELMTIALLFPLFVVGFVLYAIPYPIPRLVAARSSDRDVTSTLKLGVALLVYPVWAVGLCVAAMLFVPWPAAWLLCATALVSPFVAVWWLTRWRDRPGRLQTRPKTVQDTLIKLRLAALHSIDAAHRSGQGS